MSDDRARRSAILDAAAKAKSQAKTSAADQAIRALVKRGAPVNFQAVCREAGVSHAFLYAHPDLRQRIQHLRDQAGPKPAPSPSSDTTDTVVLTLTSQIDRLRKEHRQEVQALRAAVEKAHGENLDLRRELARRGANRTPHERPALIVDPLSAQSAASRAAAVDHEHIDASPTC